MIRATVRTLFWGVIIAAAVIAAHVALALVWPAYLLGALLAVGLLADRRRRAIRGH